MGSIWFDETEGRLLEERYDLAIGRIREILRNRRFLLILFLTSEHCTVHPSV